MKAAKQASVTSAWTSDADGRLRLASSPTVTKNRGNLEIFVQVIKTGDAALLLFPSLPEGPSKRRETHLIPRATHTHSLSDLQPCQTNGNNSHTDSSREGGGIHDGCLSAELQWTSSIAIPERLPLQFREKKNPTRVISAVRTRLHQRQHFPPHSQKHTPAWIVPPQTWTSCTFTRFPLLTPKASGGARKGGKSRLRGQTNQWNQSTRLFPHKRPEHKTVKADKLESTKPLGVKDTS